METTLEKYQNQYGLEQNLKRYLAYRKKFLKGYESLEIQLLVWIEKNSMGSRGIHLPFWG